MKMGNAGHMPSISIIYVINYLKILILFTEAKIMISINSVCCMPIDTKTQFSDF